MSLAAPRKDQYVFRQIENQFALAVLYGNEKRARWLVNCGADINTKFNNPGENVLTAVIGLEDAEPKIVRLLLDLGITVTQSALHWCIFYTQWWRSDPYPYPNRQAYVEIAYMLMKARLAPHKEGIIAAAFHPRRVAKWVEAGVEDMMFGA